jgi:hypothetical protein
MSTRSESRSDSSIKQQRRLQNGANEAAVSPLEEAFRYELFIIPDAGTVTASTVPKIEICDYVSFWNRTSLECHLKYCVTGTDDYPDAPRLMFRVGDLEFTSTIRVQLRTPALNETYESRWRGYGNLIRTGAQSHPIL